MMNMLRDSQTRKKWRFAGETLPLHLGLCSSIKTDQSHQKWLCAVIALPVAVWI
ncbi:MAG: hypothetical protein LBO67_05275 [Spirochaetaceae bacterium]|jgi:hypothetical protein|nr:hypothetical protein [Spirochaetaceae bacterium]